MGYFQKSELFFLDLGKKLGNLFFIKYLSFFGTLLDRVVAIVINSISSAQNDILMQWIESEVHFEVLRYVTGQKWPICVLFVHLLFCM